MKTATVALAPSPTRTPRRSLTSRTRLAGLGLSLAVLFGACGASGATSPVLDEGQALVPADGPVTPPVDVGASETVHAVDADTSASVGADPGSGDDGGTLEGVGGEPAVPSEPAIDRGSDDCSASDGDVKALRHVAEVATQSGKGELASRLEESLELVGSQSQEPPSPALLAQTVATLQEGLALEIAPSCAEVIGAVLDRVLGGARLGSASETAASAAPASSEPSLESVLTAHNGLEADTAACVAGRVGGDVDPNDVDLLVAISECINSD